MIFTYTTCTYTTKRKIRTCYMDYSIINSYSSRGNTVYNILNRLEKLINEINPNIIITYDTDSLYVLKTLLDNKFPTIVL